MPAGYGRDLIGVLGRQCLDQRIATREQLASEIAAWERQRKGSKARTDVHTTDKARAKMGRACPDPAAATRNAQLKES